MAGTATAYLRILNGELSGGVFVLSDLSLFEIGRAEGCHVRIPDPECGQTQARIVRTPNGWRFLNLNDERKSFVNDIPVESRPLGEGDILRFGSTELHFTFLPPKPKSDPGETPESDDVTAEAPVEKVQAVTAGPVAAALPELPEAGDTKTELDLPAMTEALDPVFKLVVIDGNESDLGREFSFGEGDEFVVGRSISADIVLMDGKISRNHCSIKLDRGHLVLSDLGSSNGTVVNGDRVKRTVLANGDYVRLGFTVLGCSVTREPVV